MGNEIERQEHYLSESPIPRLPTKHLGPKYETSHTEDWEITFRATVPAGLTARGEVLSAAAIIEQRMTEVLHQAGVADPRVQARKVGRSTYRGHWEGGVQYETGETCDWHDKLWMASRPSVNRKPDSFSGKGYWFETSVRHTADALFAPPKELEQPRQRLAEATNASGDEIMVVEDIVDAEIVE